MGVAVLVVTPAPVTVVAVYGLTQCCVPRSMQSSKVPYSERLWMPVYWSESSGVSVWSMKWE